MTDDFSALDYLIASDRSFAVYRRPGHAPELIVQSGGLPENFEALAELNGRSGFVMAPFQSNESHPVVLIRPDLSFKGNTLILRYLKNLRAEGKSGSSSSNSESISGSKSESGSSENESRNNSGSNSGSESKNNSNISTNYKAAFDLFQKALHAGSCEKIVLSRTVQLPLPKGFSAGALFGSACEAYPDAFVYLMRTPLTGTWFGSTPELLLSGENGNWQTVALAGTRRIKDSEANWDAQKDGKSKSDWDTKNIREQQVVTSYIEKQLRIKNLIGTISEPYTVRAGQLMHIKTDFRFQMPNQSCVGDLLDFLHPTPAVCGYPKMEACRLILAHEGFDRAYYSGFAGPLNKDGKTDLYVNLRCASLTDKGLTLYAGGGLMPDSELKSEWEETEVKLQTLLSLIV